jgi:hypothetical protein
LYGTDDASVQLPLLSSVQLAQLADATHLQKTQPFLSALPMFVPSLSW